MTQTAVSWLVNQINGYSHSIGLPYGMNIRIDIPDDIIEQAKAMEKEQIIDSAVQYLIKHRGMQSEQSILTAAKLSEQYYNETYEGKNNS